MPAEEIKGDRYSLLLLTRGDGKGNQYVDLELSNPELIAIGHVTTQWAFLEFFIGANIRALAKRLHVSLPADANSDSLRKRLRVWRSLASDIKKVEPEYGDRLLKIVARVGEISGDRHLIIHGRPIWNPLKKGKIEIVARERSWLASAKEIGVKAFKIARINYDLATIDGNPIIVHDALPRKPARKPRSHP